jgi:hypothetical protein
MRHYSEFQANLPAMPCAADLEPAELGFFDRATSWRSFWRGGPPWQDDAIVCLGKCHSVG